MKKKNTLKTGFLKYIRTVADFRYNVEEHCGIYYLVEEDVECSSCSKRNIKVFDNLKEAEDSCDYAKREFILNEVRKRRS